LGAGYQPIGAMLVSSKVYNAITDGRGFFQHGHTYIGHATACAAALAVQKEIENKGLLKNVNEKGELLRASLRERFADNPYIGDIRGKGLFCGLEIVADKQTKEPFDPALKLHAKIKATAMRGGLMCYAMGGTIDGKSGDHVMFAPPFIITEEHVAEMVDKFELAFNSALDEILVCDKVA